MRVRVVVLCLTGLSRKERPGPERARGRQTEPYPGTELYRGGFVQKAAVTSLSGVHSAIHCRNYFLI